MKTLRNPFLQAALCLSLLGAQGTSFAAYQITTTPGDDGENANSTTCSLREAITMVNEQSFMGSAFCLPEIIAGSTDLILLGAEPYKLKNTLVITKSVQIQGAAAGTKINSAHSSTTLTIDDPGSSNIVTVALENINFVNGGENGVFSNKSDAGTISSAENTLLKNVSISESFGLLASAISITDGALTIIDSEFFNNTGPGSVINVTGGTVSITTTAITGNTSKLATLALNGVTDFEVNQSEVSLNIGEGPETLGSLSVTSGSSGRLINTTVTGNIINGDGGSGLYVDDASLSITNSTVTANTDKSSASEITMNGLIAQNGATVTLTNSVLAGNTTSSGILSNCRSDETSQINSNGFNLVGAASQCAALSGSGDQTVEELDDLLLADLENHGGATQTLVPGIDSPLLNTAKPADCPSTDQRGLARPAAGPCDIGAVEMQGAPLANPIQPDLKKIPVFIEIDVLAAITRNESDIDENSLEIVANFNAEETDSAKSEGTFKILRNKKLRFIRGDGFSGEVSFTYSASDIDGRKSNEASIVLKNSDPSAPIAVDDLYETTRNVGINIDVLANDVRGSSNYVMSTMVIESRPTNGFLTFVALGGLGGTFNYAPDRDFTGTDTFSYSIATKEGARSNVGTVTIVIPSVGNSDDDDSLGGFNLFMLFGLSGLILSRRLTKANR